jgi:hypothetical protein
MYTAAMVSAPGKDDDHKSYNDFPESSDFASIFMMTLSNSIGDLSYPESSLWIGRSAMNYGASLVMVRQVLIIYFIQAFFIVVLLLNLLISVVSEVFDKV